MDKATEFRRRLSFARVCVEVGCSDDLSDIIPVDIEGVGSFEIHVEYSWWPSICSICKQFGHSDLHCTKVKKVWVPKVKVADGKSGSSNAHAEVAENLAHNGTSNSEAPIVKVAAGKNCNSDARAEVANNQNDQPNPEILVDAILVGAVQADVSSAIGGSAKRSVQSPRTTHKEHSTNKFDLLSQDVPAAEVTLPKRFRKETVKATESK